MTDEQIPGNPPINDADRKEAQLLASLLASPEPPQPVVIEMTREDAQELLAVLTGERMRMDKGDGSPVPQPRWGANVRVSSALMAALDAAKEG